MVLSQSREFETHCTASPEDLLPNLSEKNDKSPGKNRRNSLTLQFFPFDPNDRRSHSMESEVARNPFNCKEFVGDLSLVGLGREHSFGDELLLESIRVNKPPPLKKEFKALKVRNPSSAKPPFETRVSPPPVLILQKQLSNFLKANQNLARKADFFSKNRTELFQKNNLKAKVLTPARPIVKQAQNPISFRAIALQNVSKTTLVRSSQKIPST